MTTPYTSPIPAEMVLDYRLRTIGRPTERRVHLYPQPAGRKPIMCDPRYCRECHRERNGQ